MSVDNGIAMAPAPRVGAGVTAPRPRVALGDLLWRRRSVRGQLLITILLIDLIAAIAACGVIIVQTRNSVQVEVASSMKLADLLVLDRNPLENIRNSETVGMVMLNGRLYDARTLNEIGNHPKQRPPLWFDKQ